ncbi:MAG: hypothetical protein WEH44_07610 [Pirellulaceae bacterium]
MTCGGHFDGRMMWMPAVMMLSCAGVQAVSTAATGAAVETTIGMEGVYYLRSAGPTLVARPVDERSPIVLRVASAVRDRETTIYELRYIGTRPGQHDLGQYLVRADGQALTLPAPLLVVVHETLPSDHDGTLETVPLPGRGWTAPVRALTYGGLVTWGAITLIALARRWAKRTRAKPRVVSPQAPTLADQLRPLIEEAVAGKLAPDGLARLELLLVTHWGKVLQIEQLTSDEAWRRLRSHVQAGELIRQLESWLHARPGSSTVDVAALLAPYREAEPVADLSHRMAVRA